MKKSVYKILYFVECPNCSGGWRFDEEDFETSQDAFKSALDNRETEAVRIVKLIYPQDD
jgi:hypothetical protein